MRPVTTSSFVLFRATKNSVICLLLIKSNLKKIQLRMKLKSKLLEKKHQYGQYDQKGLKEL